MTSRTPLTRCGFLGFGDDDTASLRKIFRELCDIAIENDGLTVVANSVKAEIIRDAAEYGGIRVRLFGDLAGARVPIQADIGFGDAVTLRRWKSNIFPCGITPYLA